MISENSRSYTRTQSFRRQSTTKKKYKHTHNKNEIEIKLRKRTTDNFTHDSVIDNKIDRITSWKKSKIKIRLSLIPNILTLGLLHFFSIYNPYLYIFLYCKPAQPNICDFFLVEDKYGYLTICNTTIIYVNTKDVNPEIYELINEKDNNFITMFEYCSNRYEYNHTLKLIIPLYLDLTKLTNKNIKNFLNKGISDNKNFEIQKKKFGLNVFEISNLNIIKEYFLKNNVLKLTIVFLCIGFYIIAELYADAILLFVLSFIYTVIISYCFRKNFYDLEKHKFNLNKEYKINYLTKRNYLLPEINCNESSIPSEQIVPGDILYLKNGDLVPCDVIILEGECSVSESRVFGRIPLVKKKPLEYNDEYFNYKNNSYSIILHGMEIIEVQSKLINKCISVLCINTGYNTFKNNQISNLYFLKIKNKNYNRFKYIMSGKDPFYFIYNFTLCVVAIAIFFIKYFYDKKHKLLTNNQNFVIYFGEILSICLMPTYHAIYNITKLCTFLHLRHHNINCIDETKLLEAGIINTIFFDKTDTLSDNRIDICEFFLVYSDQLSNIYFNKNDTTKAKEIRYEHLQFYKDFIARNSLGNDSSNFTTNYNEDDLSEYKQKYRLSSLFVQILVCCVNLEKINDNICGNVIERNLLKILKFDLNTIENLNLKNICINDIENELFAAININPDEVRNIINSNMITDSNIIDTSSNVTNKIINKEEENKEEIDKNLFNHIFNIINTSNNIMRYSSKKENDLINNLKDSKSNIDNIKSENQSINKMNKECYNKNKIEKTEEDKNYEIFSRNHPEKTKDLLRIREIVKKLSNDYNLILPKINEIFPKNYYKIAESMKIGSNLKFKNKNALNPFRLIIVKKFFERRIKRSVLNVSCIVYNTLDHSLRFMKKAPPDKILRYCKDSTFPHNINEVLSKLHREGSRTLALATKKIDIFRYRHEENEDYYMNNLVFCGFISLKCKLKKETKKVITKLKDMKCDVLINTGDRIFNSISVGFGSQIIGDKNIFTFELSKNREILITQLYKSTKKNVDFVGNGEDNQRNNESENDYNNINSNYYVENKSTKMYKKQKKYAKNDGSFIINSSNRLLSGERPSNISNIRNLKKSKRGSIENNMRLKDESLQYKKYSTINEIKKPNTESTIIQKSNSANTENEETKSPPLFSGKKQNLLKAFNKLDKLNNKIKLNNASISKPHKQRKNKGSIINSVSTPSTIVECKNYVSNLYDNSKINIILNTDRDIKDSEISVSDCSIKSGSSKIKLVSNKQLQDQATYNTHLSNNNMNFSSFTYKPEILNDPKFKHNVIFCVEGEVFNFVRSQGTKKNFYKYDKLLKFFKHYCKIFYNMSVINKSELIDYFVSLPMKKVCMVGDESNDIDAILSANVGIKIINRNDVNSLLCHFLVDKTENNLEAVEIIIKYGRAFYENSYYLISCSIIFSTIETLLILYSLFLRQNIKGYQMFMINTIILGLCLSGFTAKPDKKINYNNIMSNECIFSLLIRLNIFGLFIIKGIEQFILFYFYIYNTTMSDKDTPLKVFLSELFLLSCSQIISTIFCYNSLSMYRKSFVNNFLFSTIILLFYYYLLCLLCLSNISVHPKIFDYVADFEYLVKNIDSFDDYSKLKLIIICTSDFTISLLYIKLVKYLMEKKASNYDKKKEGVKIVEVNEDKVSKKNN